MSRPVRTLPYYYGGEDNNWLCAIRAPDAKLKARSKTEHGRPDQNTNARQLVERKGSGGTVQSDMNTYELAKRSMAQVGNIERPSTAGVARQIWVQLAAHCRKRRSEVGVMFVFMREERRRHTQIRTWYVIIGHTALCNERSRRRTVVRPTPKK